MCWTVKRNLVQTVQSQKMMWLSKHADLSRSLDWIWGKRNRRKGRQTDRQTDRRTGGWIRERIANRKDRMTSWLIWVTSQLMQRRGDISKAAFPVNDQNNRNDKQKTRMDKQPCRSLVPSSLPVYFLCMTFKNEIELLQLLVPRYSPAKSVRAAKPF